MHCRHCLPVAEKSGRDEMGISGKFLKLLIGVKKPEKSQQSGQDETVCEFIILLLSLLLLFYVIMQFRLIVKNLY